MEVGSGWDFFYRRRGCERTDLYAVLGQFVDFLTTPFPAFLTEKLGDFFALSSISLPYILPNLLNGVQTNRELTY